MNQTNLSLEFRIRFCNKGATLRRKALIYFLPSLLIILTIFCNTVAAQNSLASKNTPAVNWKLDTTVSGVEFYHAIVNCNSEKVVFLKFHNKNNKVTKVYWKESFIVQKNTAQKQGPFKQKQLTLLPGQIAQTDCNKVPVRELLTYPDQSTPVYDANILNFNFQNITVVR